MPIESHGDGGFTITGDSIAVFQHLRLVRGLALEINTGMALSNKGSAMKTAASYCGSTKRTKTGVLKDYVAWLKKNMPADNDGKPWEPTGSIVKALSK